MTLYFGCPIWAFRGWVGNLFPGDAKAKDFLRHYAAVMNAIEANSTFYALPEPDTVSRWRDDTPEAFRFCFKFPRTVSHERRLKDAQADTERFLARLAPLGPRLGPFFLQMGPSFDRRGFGDLVRYLDALPRTFRYTVELRHPDWFDDGPLERDLRAALLERGVDRVLFDSRPLFSSKVLDATTIAAQGRKPRVPVRTEPVGPTPFVRFIGHNDPRSCSGWLGQWAPVVGEWLDAGDAYFFTHAPDDTYAPRLARIFVHLLHRARPEIVPPMAEWPGERPEPEPQLSLLD